MPLALGHRSFRLDDALADFVHVPLAVRGYSAGTRTEYQRDLLQFVTFLNDGRGVASCRQLGIGHLTAYLATLEARHLRAGTRRRKVAAIRSFLSFLHAHGYIASNLAAHLVPPPREHHELVFLSPWQYQALQDACAPNPRDAAIIELFLQTGIRLSELAGLRTVDITLVVGRGPYNAGSVSVRGRGRTLRTVVLNWKACQAVARYLQSRPDAPTDALFVSKFRTPLTPRAIRNVVKKYLRLVGIDVDGVSVHTLRHTFGMQHVMHGTKPELIQHTMGLAHIRAVRVYVDRSQQDGEFPSQPHAL